METNPLTDEALSEILLSLRKSDFVLDANIYAVVFNHELTPYEATLVAIRDHLPFPDQQREGFTLVFRTSQKNEYFEQGTFLFKHPKIGDIPLFMVPIGPDSEGYMQYEIVIN